MTTRWQRYSFSSVKPATILCFPNRWQRIIIFVLICESFVTFQATIQLETMSQYRGCPWRNPDYNYGDGVIGLHEEIDHFYKYILPTPCEHVVRNELVKRIENLVHDLWPQAVVEIFGSFRTGLQLPNSDIDLVVLGECPHREEN